MHPEHPRPENSGFWWGFPGLRTCQSSHPSWANNGALPIMTGLSLSFFFLVVVNREMPRGEEESP